MSSEECVLLLSSIKPPVSYVFGAILSVIAAVACCGNTISLIILWQPKVRSQSNKLLASLIIADSLVGYVQLPITVWHLFTKTDTALQSCTFEAIRSFCIVSLTGASTLAITFIAYDRYMLLTSLSIEHERRMSNRKVYLMIAANWIVPMASVSIRYVNFTCYMYVLLLLAVQPLVVMIVAYVIITRTIRRNEEELRVIYREQTLPERRLKRGTKMGRVAVLLIGVYFLCSLPTSVYLILYLSNSSNRLSFVRSYCVQIYHLCAMVVFSLNSCINPIIYAFKYPEFRTILRQIRHKYLNKMFRM